MAESFVTTRRFLFSKQHSFQDAIFSYPCSNCAPRYNDKKLSGLMSFIRYPAKKLKSSQCLPQTHLISKDDIPVVGPRESKLVQSWLADIRAVFDPPREGNWTAWPYALTSEGHFRQSFHRAGSTTVGSRFPPKVAKYVRVIFKQANIVDANWND
jgi:hypothetical protein